MVSNYWIHGLMFKTYNQWQILVDSQPLTFYSMLIASLFARSLSVLPGMAFQIWRNIETREGEILVTFNQVTSFSLLFSWKYRESQLLLSPNIVSNVTNVIAHILTKYNKIKVKIMYFKTLKTHCFAITN